MLGFKNKKGDFIPTGRTPFSTLEAGISERDKKAGIHPKFSPLKYIGFANAKKDEFNMAIQRIEKDKNLTPEQKKEAIKQVKFRYRSDKEKAKDMQTDEELTNMNLKRTIDAENARKEQIRLLDLKKELLRIEGLDKDKTIAEYDKVKNDILGANETSETDTNETLHGFKNPNYGRSQTVENPLRQRLNEAEMTEEDYNALKKKYPELNEYELNKKFEENIILSGATDENVDLKTGKKTMTLNKSKFQLLSNRLDQLRGTGKVLREGLARAGAKSALGQTITSDGGEISDSDIRSFAKTLGANVGKGDIASKIPNFAVALRSMTPKQKNYLLIITDKKQLKKEFERLNKISNMKERELIKQRNNLAKKLREMEEKAEAPNASAEIIQRVFDAKRLIDNYDSMIQLRGLQAKVGELSVGGLDDFDYLSSVREQKELGRQIRDDFDERQEQYGSDSDLSLEAKKRQRQMIRQMGIV